MDDANTHVGFIFSIYGSRQLADNTQEGCVRRQNPKNRAQLNEYWYRYSNLFHIIQAIQYDGTG